MNLYIIRHAIAVDESMLDYELDHERPLTDKGRKKMRQIWIDLVLPVVNASGAIAP